MIRDIAYTDVSMHIIYIYILYRTDILNAGSTSFYRMRRFRCSLTFSSNGKRNEISFGTIQPFSRQCDDLFLVPVSYFHLCPKTNIDKHVDGYEGRRRKNLRLPSFVLFHESLFLESDPPVILAPLRQLQSSSIVTITKSQAFNEFVESRMQSINQSIICVLGYLSKQYS